MDLIQFKLTNSINSNINVMITTLCNIYNDRCHVRATPHTYTSSEVNGKRKKSKLIIDNHGNRLICAETFLTALFSLLFSGNTNRINFIILL